MDIKEALSNLSSRQLQRALELKQRIEQLQAELESTVAGGTSAPAAPSGKRQLSAAARERIAAAQRERWARSRPKAASTRAARSAGKRRMTPAQRAKIAEAARRRWAAAKAAGRSRL
jgi:hypothetical protein